MRGTDTSYLGCLSADISGDGEVNLNDTTLFGRLWRGTSGHNAWQVQSLPPKP